MVVDLNRLKMVPQRCGTIFMSGFMIQDNGLRKNACFGIQTLTSTAILDGLLVVTRQFFTSVDSREAQKQQSVTTPLRKKVANRRVEKGAMSYAVERS